MKILILAISLIALGFALIVTANGGGNDKTKTAPSLKFQETPIAPGEVKTFSVNKPRAHEPAARPSPPLPIVIESQEDIATEEKLSEELKTIDALIKIADITEVKCNEKNCTVVVEAKEENANTQMPIYTYMKDHPEFYQEVLVYEDEENPRLTKFTFNTKE